MNLQYKVELSHEERQYLECLTSKGKYNSRIIKRANILLLADQHANSHEKIAELLGCGTSTVFRVKQRFVEDGLETALNEGKRPGRSKALSASEEATLVSIACTTPPEGSSRWTLSLLSEQLIALTDLESISPETLRQRLKENELKPWKRKMWCIGQMTADYVAQMEHILTLYSAPPEVDYPIVNFDEAGKQLVEDVNQPIEMTPGQPLKVDYEYRRAGVANIFMMMDRHRCWRKVKVTHKKCMEDFAQCMRELVDEHYPNAKKIRVVMDNYATHKPGSLYQAFGAQEARRLMDKLEFHYTPKHASWLNMAEIEIGVMTQQCLDRRIANMGILKSELAAWEERRNELKASINWMFDVDTARSKMPRAYSGLGNSTCQN